MEVLSPMKLAINHPATIQIDGADGSLLCPVCSATYIHQKAVTVFLRREDATTGFRVRIEGDEERGPVITVGSNLGGKSLSPAARHRDLFLVRNVRADIYPGVCPTQGGNFRFVAGDRSSARQCAAMTADVCNFDYFTVRACVIRSDSGLMTKRIATNRRRAGQATGRIGVDGIVPPDRVLWERERHSRRAFAGTSRFYRPRSPS